ncbi:aldehyde dehydrogenase [Cohnella abietis]|uniref:Aldehyde dehydrogenase n=1 Tax=Cohnella abietis TaxID=2507935 RepID=A0A3T1DB64_9BACL|nr:aldehyde dehydrogenase [Cohnella abietis]BBI35357.1 putative aldehyde dehydrogenase YwdH [Cohnella abietis]
MSDIPLQHSEQLTILVKRQQDYYRSGATRTVAFRREQLSHLRDAIHKFELKLLAALKQDLNKSELEAYSTEIGIVLREIRIAIRFVRRWSKPRRVCTPLSHLGASSTIIPEPLGTTLIIGPWNYPVNLMLAPVIAAIAAGNTIIMKPSEIAPATSSVLESLIRETFLPEYITVVEGGASLNTQLLEQPFDHIFFTGSSSVGKIVMEAAAKKLIPVTLELGGKSPCIVHKDANIKLAAKRIVFGKYTNVGQTCVAPDYLLVHKDVKQELISEMVKVIETFYGSSPIDNPTYGRIVNERHFSRLSEYLTEGRILFGGQTDEAAYKIAPTLIEGVALDSKIMQGEIFGPILPLLDYENSEEIFYTIQANPKPLALYLFAQCPEFQKIITEGIAFGGGCINDTIIHLGNPYLPFGGVGSSGIGSYHGEHGFRAFTHYKGLLRQTTLIDMPFRYPNSKWGMSLIRKLLR